jgi:hypothetical protein
VGEVNSIGRQRAGAEARKDIAAKPGKEGRHEDELLRYLGAMYYEVRHGRANQEDLERTVTEVDTHVRENGPISVAGGRGRTRRRWWRLRRRPT